VAAFANGELGTQHRHLRVGLLAQDSFKQLGGVGTGFRRGAIASVEEPNHAIDAFSYILATIRKPKVDVPMPGPTTGLVKPYPGMAA
jgi:hypothetical protein